MGYRLVEREGGAKVDVMHGNRLIVTIEPPDGGGANEVRRMADAEGGLPALVRKIAAHALAHIHGSN